MSSKQTIAVDRSVQLIPIAALSVSATNVRKVKSKSIAELAASIKAQGLIQNLTAVAINGSGKFEVVAGGRRLQALQILVKDKTLPKDFKVPCRVVDAEEATNISLTENVMREAMHPADQFDAFKKLIDDGRGVDDVAAQYGVTPAVVHQRLKLANVADVLIKQFRDGKATLEQMMALALSDDHEQQVRVWTKAKSDWMRSPNHLREAITEKEVRLADRRVRFVGVDAYEKAGGAIRNDLFSADRFVIDIGMLDELVSKKLQARADKVAKEGWAWVDFRFQCDYSVLSAFTRAEKLLKPMTDKQLEKATALNEQRREVNRAIDALADGADEQFVSLQKQLYNIDVKLAKIDDGRRMDDAAVKQIAGALVYADHQGKLVVERGLVRPDDAKRLRRNEVAATVAAGEKDEADTIHSNGLSDALTRRLTAQRTLALRAALASNPHAALVLTVHALVDAEFYTHDQSALDLSVMDRGNVGGVEPGIEETTTAGRQLAATHAELQALLPASAEDALPWLSRQSVDVLLRFLACGIQPSLNAVLQTSETTTTYSGRNYSASHAVAAMLDFRMGYWWQADETTYFGSVSKSLMRAAVEEATGEDAAHIEKAKKADAIKAAAQAVAGRGWLPTLLRE